jgi:membrane associated rhomboid family serine protease
LLPLRDDIPHQQTPYVGYGLMAACILVFLVMVGLPDRQLQGFMASFAVTPAVDLPLALRGRIDGLMPFVTNMFLHGGWLHLGGNMLFLYIFGDNVEDRMGHLGFLAFFLVCGIAASFAHALSTPGSHLPSLGASGAIAGVLAAYMVYFPHARIRSLVTLGFFWTSADIPAFVYLILWFIMQAFSGVASLGRDAASGGVAWWAHIGGFVVGLMLAKIVERRPQQRRWRQ